MNDRREYFANYYREHRLKKLADNKIQKRQHRYGLSAEGYQAFLDAQGGVCAICGEECITGRSLAVDHDHATGEVRGLLCLFCNTKLGWLETNNVLEYLGIADGKHT